MIDRGSAVRLTPQQLLLIDRWMGRLPFPRWSVVAAIGVILIILPAGLGYLEDVPRFLTDYRAQFIYPLLIVYILLAVPLVQTTCEIVAQSLRPMVRMDGRRSLPGWRDWRRACCAGKVMR